MQLGYNSWEECMSQTVDQFWVQHGKQSQETPAACVHTPQFSAKATMTCGDRQTALLSSFRPLAEFAAKSSANTNKLHAGMKNQNQRRIQPHASGAPTTKRSHVASRANQKEKKAAAKALVAKALGRA